VKSNALEAQDSMLGWMRQINKHLLRLNRAGRIDLLSTGIEVFEAGELTVATLDEVPESLPFGSPVFVVESQQMYVQDPDTREWQPAPSE